MKKFGKIIAARRILALAAVLPVLWTSCQKNSGTAGFSARRSQNTVDTLKEFMQKYDNPQDNGFSEADVFGTGEGYLAPREEISSDVDIDLTKVSSTFVYAEVFNMMLYPEYYVGKTVRMTGDFSVYKPVLPSGQVSKDNFYACVIADAASCCQQGLTFDVGQAYKFPDDFPKEGSSITVTGTFAIHEDKELAYFYVKDAKLL